MEDNETPADATYCMFFFSDGTFSSKYLIKDADNTSEVAYGDRDAVLAKRIGPDSFSVPDIVRLERGVDGVKLTYVVMANGATRYKVNGDDVQGSQFSEVCRLLALKGVQL